MKLEDRLPAKRRKPQPIDSLIPTEASNAVVKQETPDERIQVFLGLRKQSDAYLKEETHTILASSNLDSSQINFHIPAVNNMYTDPASLRVYFEIAITDKNGVPVPTGLSEARVKKIIEYRGQLDMWEALPDKDKGESEDESGKMMKPKLPAGITQELVDSCIGKVRLANDLASNFFSEVRVNINDRPMQVDASHHQIKSYVRTLFGHYFEADDMLFCKYKFRGDAKEDELMTEIHRDSVIKVDSPLRCDIQSMKGMLPKNTNINIILTRSKPEFLLVTQFEGTYKVELKKCFLYVNRVIVKPDLDEHVMSYWNRNPDKYCLPMSRLEAHTCTIPIGTNQYLASNLSIKRVPQYLLCALTEINNVQAGDYQMNPTRFYHHNLRSIGLRFGAVLLRKYTFTSKEDFTLLQPYESLKPHFGYEKIYSRDNLTPVPFDLKAFKNNYFFICFDLNKLAAKHIGQPCINQISFELDFETETKHTLSFVAISQDKCGLEIKPDGECDGPMVPYAVKTYLPILESVRTGVLSDRAILCQVLDDRRFVEACVILLRNCVEVPNLRVPKEIETKLKKEKSKVKLLLDRKQSLANKRRALTVKLVKLIAQIRA